MQSKWPVSLVLASVILISSILACGSTPTATPTDTSVPVATSAPTSSPVPATPTAPAYYTENFDQDTGRWSYFVVDASARNEAPAVLAPADIRDVSVKVTNGRMTFDLGGKNLWVYLNYDSYQYDDVRLDVVAENRGVNNNSVSLICRYSKADGWYEFNVANSGLYNILYAHFTPDDKVVYSRLADGGSNKIKQGKEINEYGISCRGHTLTLYINGFETRRIDDNQYVLRTGKVGISTSSFDILPIKVEFDSVKISKP
jgi:hypothetical protein